MTYLGQNRLEAPAFVPPEPYVKPPSFDPSQLPRWVKIAMVIALVALGILAIWQDTLKAAMSVALIVLGILAVWLSLRR